MAQAFHGGGIAQAAQEFGRPADEFLDFSSNLNGLAPAIPPELWLRWLAEVRRYPEADSQMLRQRVADTYEVDAQFLLPTSGAIEALYLVARLFIGRKVAIIEPSFSDYARAFDAAGCQVERLTLQPADWARPLPELADILAGFDVVVFGNPNNPTGKFDSLANVRTLLAMPQLRGKAWVIDEAFIEFVPDHRRETLLPLLAEYPSLLLIRSLTKSWCVPGLRLGFVATANTGWLSQLSAWQAPWALNGIAHAWATTFLTPENWRLLQEALAGLDSVRGALVAMLVRIPGLRIYPSAANFLLMELLDPRLDATALYRELGRRGILIRVCDSFHGLPQGRFIRIAVKSPEANERLQAALGQACLQLSGGRE